MCVGRRLFPQVLVRQEPGEARARPSQRGQGGHAHAGRGGGVKAGAEGQGAESKSRAQPMAGPRGTHQQSVATMIPKRRKSTNTTDTIVITASVGLLPYLHSQEGVRDRENRATQTWHAARM